MNNRKLFASVVALLIVMQCIATPISYAAGDGLPEEQPSFYTPAGEAIPFYEAVAAAEAGEDGFANGHYFQFLVGYGRPTVGEDKYSSGSASYRRIEYEGSTKTESGFTYMEMMDLEKYGIVDLPMDEDLGRIPDMEFDGWYIYGSNYLDNTNYQTWSRIDGSRKEDELKKDIKLDGTGDHRLSAYQVDEDTTVMRLKVNADTASSFLSTEGTYYDAFSYFGTSYKGNMTFPIVGGWVKSSNATATGAVISVGSIGGEELSMYASADAIGEDDAISFDPNRLDYYLRVGAEVDVLALDLDVFEPFLEFQADYAAFEEFDMENGAPSITYSRYSPLTVTNSAVDGQEKTAAAASPVQITINGDSCFDDSDDSLDGTEPVLVYKAVNDGYYMDDGGNMSSSKLWRSENSENPAHSNWTLEGIALKESTPDDQNNVISVTITAPNGEDEITYTFYIQRMAEPAGTLEPGNTPVGMAEREPDTSWYTGSGKVEDNLDDIAANRQAWIDYFKTNRAIRNYGYNVGSYTTPDGFEPTNDGVLYGGKFGVWAWGSDAYTGETLTGTDDKTYSATDPEIDFDVNPNAIVAYQNHEFSDPGITVITSIGGTIYSNALKEGDDKIGTLQRRIKLDVPADGSSLTEALANEALGDTGAVATRYYVDGELTADDAWETINISDLSVDFSDLEILPGVYTIEYRFIDPYSKPTDPEDYLYFERPLIVLAIPGDIDMDGTATVADAYALESLLDEGVFAAANINDRTRLFAWRVANVADINLTGGETDADIAGTRDADGNREKDGVLDESVTALRAGWHPELVTMTGGVSNYFYPPLSDITKRYESQDATGVGSAELKIEYIGKQKTPDTGDTGDTGETTETVTPSESASRAIVGGSGSAVAPELVVGASGAAATTAATVGDFFWVEVKLGALEGYDNIESFTFSLIYDGRYVRPAVMEDAENSEESMVNIVDFDEVDTAFKDGYAAADEENVDWATVIYKYNLRNETGTVWDTKETDVSRVSYTISTASKPDGDHSTHFSRAMTDIESAVYSAERSYNSVGELTFSIQYRQGTYASLKNGGTILRVPFYMHATPKNPEDKENLVSIDLGMQEFVIVNQVDAPSTLADGDTAPSYSTTLDVSAYSTQSSIYGGETVNLREKISLDDTTIECLVPLTEKEIITATLTNQFGDERGNNARYGAYFRYVDSVISIPGARLDGELPPGLKFDSGYIEGTPTKAGEYTFMIDDNRYTIIVEKAPLRVYADDENYYEVQLAENDDDPATTADAYKNLTTSYYGEADFTDGGYTTMLAAIEDGNIAYEPNTTHKYELTYYYFTEDLIVGTSRLADGSVYTFEGGADNDHIAESNNPEIKGGGAGTMANLAKLIIGDFTHPTVESGRAANSDVGSYQITIDVTGESKLNFDGGLLDNYYFVAANNTASTNTDERYEQAYVVVLPRPITVDELNYDVDGNGVQDETLLAQHVLNDTDRPELDKAVTAKLDKTNKNFDVSASKLANPIEAPDGSGRDLYNGYPLGEDGYIAGDSLEISYNVEYIRTDVDNTADAPRKYFIIKEGETEPRDLKITNIKLVGGEDVNNYTVENTTVPNVVEGGLVKNVEVESITNTSWGDLDIKLVYGEEIELAGNVQAQLRYSGAGEQPNAIEYSNPELFAAAQMYISIVTKSRMDWEKEQLGTTENPTRAALYFGNGTVEDRDDMLFYDGGEGVVVEQLTDTTKLEATAANAEEWYVRLAYARNVDGVLVIYKTDYSPTPITVEKRKLVLTVTAKNRYYGEENVLDYTFFASDDSDPTAGLASWDADIIDSEIPTTGANKGVGTSAQLLKALGYESVEEWAADGDETERTGDDGEPPTLRALSTHMDGGAELPKSGVLKTFLSWPEVDEKTDYSLLSYYAGIYGATHKNYTFVYIWPGVTDEITGKDTRSTEYGFAPFRINRRPIVLNSLPTESLDTVYSLTTVYSDMTETDTAADGKEPILVVSDLELSTADGVEFILPEKMTGSATSYYLQGESQQHTDNCTISPDSSAIVNGDTVHITFSIELLKQNAAWMNLNNGYFDMFDADGNVLAERQVDVVMRSISLNYEGANNRSSNYVIVFDSASEATYTIPKAAVVYDRSLADGEYTYTKASEIEGALSDPFYFAGFATVKTRPITGIELTAPPSQTDYIYGDLFYPTGLEVTLTMDTTYGKLSEITRISDDGEVIIDDRDDNKLKFTYTQELFELYGLDIALIKESDGKEIPVEYETMLVPATHDGGYVVVGGRRVDNHKDHEEHKSYTDTSYIDEDYKITVGKRQITLSVVDQYRYYGEENYSVRYADYGDAKFEYTFSISDLIDSDKNAIIRSGYYDSVNSLGYGYISALASDNKANSALSNLDASFDPPTIETTADGLSVVNTADGYPITISGGSMSNYEFAYADGAVRVYPRPIKVTGYYAGYSTGIYTDSNNQEFSTDRSIYGIYTEAITNVYNRTLPYIDKSYRSNAGTVFNTMSHTMLQPGIPNSTNTPALTSWQWFDVTSAAAIDDDSSAAVYPATYLQNPEYNNIPSYAKTQFYLSADGIIGTNDNPYFNVQVTFADGKMDQNPTVADAKVTGIAHSGDMYYFVSAETGKDLAATVDIRTIEKISITALPNKNLNSYKYGETLDLSGLTVRITYARGDEAPIPDQYVSYDSYFPMYGLYVNYYDSDAIPPDDWELEYESIEEAYASIVTDYRPASSGDHLTIAPVHDDPSLASKPSTWEYGSFEHHGKRIIISARAAGTDRFVTPMIIRWETETNDPNLTADPQVIAVAPREIEYTLAAEDKDYDGTTRAVGSIRFTNMHPTAGDLVYAATGASYEGNWTWVNGGSKKAALQSAISANGYLFNSGVVGSDGRNTVLDFDGRSAWNSGTLTFEFVSPNVRYVDGGYLANTDANLSSAYWASEPDPKTSTDADWDEYTEVGAMPVDVTNIILAGPDAANYTLRFTDTDNEPSTTENVYKVDMTRMDKPSTTAPQDYAPYATINRARRLDIDTAKLGIPSIEIDDRTGVVRVLYNTTGDEVVTSIKEASATDRETRTGGVSSDDDYESELHIEYAIEYFLPGTDGGINLDDKVDYVGANGEVWQDTYYFGGEAVNDLYGDGSFHAKEYGFVSEEEEAEELAYDSELLGQLYKWTVYDSRLDPTLTVPYTFEEATSNVKLIQYLTLDEDDNLLPRDTTTWLLDYGFEFTVADTNASARVVEINGEQYYYFYGYYTTDRDPIPRGAYILGKVRIAQTHNYEASDFDDPGTGDVYKPLYSADGYDGTDEALLDELVTKADAKTAEVNKYITDVAADDREDIGDAPENNTDVLRMYGYRLDLRTAEEMDSADDTDETVYDYRLLRAVWFTDYTTYIEQEQLDAVVYNDLHSHYSGYYWDDLYQNALEFDEDVPIVLGSPLQLEVDRENREPQTQFETFNAGYTIPIYVETGDYRLIPERWIDILLDELEFYEDDEPFDLSTLEVEFFPKRYTLLQLKWTSSDENVVRITEDGMLEIVGAGTAVLTATSYFGKTDTIIVTVAERPEPPVEPIKQTGIFNHELLAEFLGLDADYFFYPEREMTRGELVVFASMFFIANDSWEKSEVIEFIDIVGNEPYAEAVALMSEWGVIVGVGGDMFAGERIATRAEAAAILARMLGFEPGEYVGKPTFIDSTVNDTWAAGYIAALRALGATNGVGNNLFAPNRGITRAEAAAMFTRLLNHQTPTPQVIIPADVAEDHWAFGHIVRAVNNVILPAKLESEAETETETEE